VDLQHRIWNKHDRILGNTNRNTHTDHQQQVCKGLNMNKSDLRSEMMVVTRSGEKGIVLLNNDREYIIGSR
jgi:hypothetical protein